MSPIYVEEKEGARRKSCVETEQKELHVEVICSW
jgi:hypothetical protein